MATRPCFFCRGSSETQPIDGGFTACRRCCKAKLIPFLQAALGDEELARQVGDLTRPYGGSGAKPMIPRMRSTADLTPAEMSLIRSARLARQTARAEGRGLSTTETRLSLAAAALEQERLTARRLAARRPSHGDARAAAVAMCRRLSMAGHAQAGAELNTGTATTAPRPARHLKRVPQQTLPASKDGIRSLLRELVQRAGMQAVAG